mgnify:CR=1 FL=1
MKSLQLKNKFQKLVCVCVCVCVCVQIAELTRTTNLRLFCSYCVVVLSSEPTIRGLHSCDQLVVDLSVHPNTGRRQLRERKRCRWRVVELWLVCGSLVVGLWFDCRNPVIRL